jgi:methionyl-tRNA formyltransferase
MHKPSFGFFGSPRFAEVALGELIARGFTPAFVVTNPDRPVGRKGVITPPPVKTLALSEGVPVLQPEKVKDAAEDLRSRGADLFIVAAYAQIIPKDIVDMPALGTLGVHPSLLPLHRGASPIQSAILAGDARTGTTIYKLDEKMDHGPIFAQKSVDLDDAMDYRGLEEILAKLGGELAAQVLPKLADGSLTPEPQDEQTATYTKKFSTADAFVDPETLDEAMSGEAPETARRILRTINAFREEPGAWTTQAGARTKLLRAEIADGALRLRSIQKEGRTPIDL